MADYNLNVTNGKTMSQFSEVTSPNATDTLWILSGGSLKKIQAKNLVSALTNITFSGAGAHNAIYRGNNLGTALAKAQTDAIAAGTFDGMYIGDYWVINNVTWRIAAFDYYLNTGDTNCGTHHIVIVPDSCLDHQKMNETDVVTGGYVGSEMYTTFLPKALTTITAAFGSAHILKHRNYFVNATTNGVSTGMAWLDSQVELMTENNVYGAQIMSPLPTGGTVNPWDATGVHNYRVDKSQFPLFAMNPSIIGKDWFWLRDVVSASSFAIAGGNGRADCSGASGTGGVRPAFCIY